MFTIKKQHLLPTLVLILLALATTAHAQRSFERSRPTTDTQVEALQRLAGVFADRAATRKTSLFYELKNRTDGPQGILNTTEGLQLMGVVNGRPRFYQTTNLFAARSVGTENIWPGGITGLNLDGANLAGELAVWDLGKVLLTHIEFQGRVAQIDGASTVQYHGTHVAGTLVAAGISPLAKGMSFAANLDSYDWSLDDTEMADGAAAGLLISNHSYANPAGWAYVSGTIPWYWYGDPLVSETEDAGFGYYGPESQGWDQIAFNAPHYLIVKAAANDRDDLGPEAGGDHYLWDPDARAWVVSNTVREPDGGLDGYDSIQYKGTAKNILTVGAVWDVDGGWSQPSDVSMSGFSGWGPTDDGRIKPDLVANGMGLRSCYTSNDSSYIALSGTSMASPNTAGSLHLLAQLWKDLNGEQPPRAATLKGIALHTASEAGLYDGPDYEFGWGLLDAEEAGLLIADNAVFPDRVHENILTEATADTLMLWSNGLDPLTVTVCWTDPAGPPSPWVLNDPSLKLVNDLDLRLERGDGSLVHLPWILDPGNPTAAATTGDNFRDNVEIIEVSAPISGFYRVIVNHKGVLDGGLQAYSLVTTGFSAPVYHPVVSNVTFSQRTNGTGLVDINYDVVDEDSPTVNVTVEASSDGGVTWDLTLSTWAGWIGPNVTPGTGKFVVWDFAADYPDQFFPNVVVRVTAVD